MPAPLAVTLGDPAGIGPEIVAAAWEARAAHALPPFFAIGAAESLAAIGFTRVRLIADPAQAPAIFPDALPLLPVPHATPVTPGQPATQGALAAIQSLETGVALARSGAAAALVTAPVAKAQLYAAGFRHPGQTEFVAERCGVAEADAAMLLVGGGLRVAPVTIHIPLAEVPSRLTTSLILTRARAVHAALIRDFGIPSPRLALAGLNPHAGEDGALGPEDRAIIAPAIARLRADGIDAIGPLPADTMFHAAARATYDAALAMYHDQALIPVKTLAFETGVNMTVGLPIIRTAPDHGTAFGIAGRGAAHPGAMIAAIALAAECAARRAAA